MEIFSEIEDEDIIVLPRARKFQTRINHFEEWNDTAFLIGLDSIRILQTWYYIK